MIRYCLGLFVAVSLLLGGCASLPDNGQNAYEAKMTSKLSKKVRVGDPPPLRDVSQSRSGRVSHES